MGGDISTQRFWPLRFQGKNSDWQGNLTYHIAVALKEMESVTDGVSHTEGVAHKPVPHKTVVTVAH